jgi:hypothetical protein
MKRMLILLTTILVLAMSAGAQGPVTFGDMPDALTPSPMPNGYAGLNWTGFYYVDPFKWSGAGAGFKHSEWMMGPDVVFAPFGCAGLSCYASLSLASTPLSAPIPPAIGIYLVSAEAAAGYPTTGMAGSPLVVTAYRDGKFVGSHTYLMNTDVRRLDFPTEWGSVTQVMFQGSVVLYNVTVYVSR